MVGENIDYDEILDDFIKSIKKKTDHNQLELESEQDLDESMIKSDDSEKIEVEKN